MHLNSIIIYSINLPTKSKHVFKYRSYLKMLLLCGREDTQSNQNYV